MRQGDSPPAWQCVANDQAGKPRMCPICLASNTKIARPDDEEFVENIAVGMQVWSQNSLGERIRSVVIEVARTPVPSTHRVVHLVLSDGREVWVSPDHPTANGQRVADIKGGDWHGGSRVKSAEHVAYAGSYTYDLLPDSETGVYWANGILLASSLK